MPKPTRDWAAVAARLASEPLLSLSEAAAILPRARPGRKCSTATLWRWIVHGKRGVYLDAVRSSGNGWWTSAAAVQRFQAELSLLSDTETKPRYATVTEWDRRAEDAAEKLRRMGA